MIIDYFPVLFSTVLFSTLDLDLLHCHYFNKIIQLEKRCLFLLGVRKCVKMTFLGSCGPEKDFFPFTAMFYHRSEGYSLASFLAKTLFSVGGIKLPQIRIHVPYLHHWVTSVELIPPTIKELAEGFTN